MVSAVLNSEAAILSRAIRPEEGNLSPDAAKSLLSISLPESDQRRALDLSAKAREGALTPAEAAELDNYCDVGRLLELMKSKARLSLQRFAAE